MIPEIALTNNFRLLGPNRILKEPSDSSMGGVNRDFNPHIYHGLPDQDKLELLLTRKLICELLGVKSFNQIDKKIFGDPKQKKILNKEFVEKYGAMYGLGNRSIEEIESRVQKSLQEADLVINTFENQETGLLRHLRTSIGITNEIPAIKDPVDLLLIIFSPKASQQLRYEARRKLMFMDMSFRSNLETGDHNAQIDNLLRFLNTNMWKGGLGVTDDVEIISEHSPFDYSCQKVNILSKDEKVLPSAYKRYTKFSMRKWENQNGEQKHTYVEHRLKDPVARILKLMRKDTKDPSKIDDYLGLKFVFETKKDIYDFLFTLQKKILESGSMVVFEEYYDTIANGNDFRITNPGSSNKLEIVKVHAIINGARIELQMHTFRTFLDSRYHDERGFEVFAIKRLFEGEKKQNGDFDSGAIDLIYPSDIYGPDVLSSKDALLDERRTAVRNAAFYIPKERTKQNYLYEKYTSEEFLSDMIKIAQQLDEYPEQIIAVGTSGHFMAAQLSKLLGGVPIVEYNESLKGINKNKRSLVVNGLTKDARRIKKIKGLIPNSKVAVIAERLENETKTLVDYRARNIKSDVWFNYYWEMPDLNISFAQGVALFYRVNKVGQLEFLVEESKEVQEDNNLKLIGGKHNKRDLDLSMTILRELEEETGKKYKRSDFIPLDNLSFEFKPDLDKDVGQADVKKGFSQAFAKKVGTKFNLPVKEKEETRNHIWVTVDEFKKRSMWPSYSVCIDKWLTQIQKIENVK